MLKQELFLEPNLNRRTDPSCFSCIATSTIKWTTNLGVALVVGTGGSGPLNKPEPADKLETKLQVNLATKKPWFLTSLGFNLGCDAFLRVAFLH